MIIIVGLGNIGKAYENTVHNMGFKVIDKLAEKLGIELKKEKFKSVIGEGRYKGESILLAKPTTFMNNSGQALAMLKKKFADARIIVAVDDIDLERGNVRYRQHGSAGTHNGLRSIVEYIGQEFERVKVGVGRDKAFDLADYVLKGLTKEELASFEEPIEKAANMILEQIG
ncbi:MAG: aminoacyl-tRNA hydrolase [Clostridia bacterium]|nr:aminoacyl-tRNA hydrolase [Clostridia bacterium]